MLTVSDIEQSVANLTQNDMVQFRKWFEEFDAQQWDKQFEDDAVLGRLDAIADVAIADFRNGKAGRL